MVLKRFRSSSKVKLKKRMMDHDFKSSKENIMNNEETSPKESRLDKYSKSVSESEGDTGYRSPKSKTRSEERRRSSRERRFIYGTFNQSAITDVYLGMPASKYDDNDDNDDNHTGRRHRKSSSSVSPKAEHRILRSPPLKSRRGRPAKRSIAVISRNETAEDSVSPAKEVETPHTNDDMYTRIKRQRRASQRIASGDFVETDFVGKRSRRAAAKSAETIKHPRRSLRKKVRLESEEREEVVDIPKDSESKEDNREEAVEETADGDGGNENEEDGEEEEEEEETSESSEEEAPRKYSLRERRAPPTHFQHELRESRFRRCRMRNLYGERSYSSNRDRSARRPRSRMHRSRALNRGSSSTSSSSSDSDSNDGPSADEARFQRRKAKSMMRARQRCRPMNFTEEDLKANTVLRDRSMIGGSLADVEPMTVDKNVTFESVGGLETVVRSLKEMILFPLMYSEVFDKFKVAPPRGVLFHGPPGTGKTLVARALANECSPEGGRKVAFFMRKGADCLSKWVGESERQLRLLFNEAYTMRPSIIFFDEIDGLAPVRSTRQDQIHSSIVSTLLALLDGLDSRGEVVVIGATNRLDAIDPALRRPGRFDREFYFPLPRETARQQILKIHTSVWPNPPSGNLLDRLAKATNGYCGADLKALCTEAVLSGLRRRYPQVYLSKAKLQLDTSEIEVCETDFQVAMESIVAAGARVESSASRPLSDVIMPLVKETLEGIVERVRMEFPAAAQTLRQQVTGEDDAEDHLIAEDAVDEHGMGQSWSRLCLGARGPQLLRRPRLLLLPDGEALADQSWEERLSLDGGQAAYTAESSVLDQHLLPALFHRLEGIHVFTVDSPSLFNVSARTPEESLSQLWRESLRLAPSIIYIPRIDELLSSLSDTVTHCLMCLMAGGDPSARVLVLATVSAPGQALPPRIAHFFQGCTHRFTTRPSKPSRRLFFHDLFLKWPLVAPPLRRVAAKRVLEVLPMVQEATEIIQRRLTSRESEMLFEKEEYIMRQMRLFLRDVLSKLQRDRRFSIFARPVDPEEVPDYYEIIKKPMDLSTINLKINTHKYESVKDFLDDIDQICSNALEYNPDTTPADRELRNRACCLKDLAHAISKLDDHDDFNEKCAYVSSARRRRGLTSNCSLPNFYHTKPREPAPPALEPAGTATSTAPPAAPPVTPMKVSTDVPNKVAPASAPSKMNNLESLPSTPFGSIPRSATGHRLSRRLQHLAPEVVNKDVKERRHLKRHSDEHVTSKSDRSHRDVSGLELAFEEAEGEKQASRSGSECANSPPALSPVFAWNDGRGSAALREAVQEAVQEAEDGQSGSTNHRTRHGAHTTGTSRSNGGKKNEKQTPTVPRLTRGLASSNKLAEKAVSILEQPMPDLIVPKQELAALLDRCVTGTEGWSVTNLESIYSRLAARLLSFERVWDRTRLAAEYQEVLVDYAI